VLGRGLKLSLRARDALRAITCGACPPATELLSELLLLLARVLDDVADAARDGAG